MYETPPDIYLFHGILIFVLSQLLRKRLINSFFETFSKPSLSSTNYVSIHRLTAPMVLHRTAIVTTFPHVTFLGQKKFFKRRNSENWKKCSFIHFSIFFTYRMLIAVRHGIKNASFLVRSSESSLFIIVELLGKKLSESRFLICFFSQNSSINSSYPSPLYLSLLDCHKAL